MTGPSVVMPQAPSLPPQPGAKVANPANAAKTDAGKSGGFAALLAGLDGETDAPRADDQDTDAERDQSAGPLQMQMILPLPITMPPLAPLPSSPKKTPQSRFAEELSAALPADLAQAKLPSVPSATEAGPPIDADAARLVSSPIVSGPPNQPAIEDASPTASSTAPRMVLQGQAAAPSVSTQAKPFALSDNAPATSSRPPVNAAATSSLPPVSAPATSLPTPVSAPAISSAPFSSAQASAARGPGERNVVKSAKDDGPAAVTDPRAPALAAMDPSAATSETPSDTRSGQDGERGDTARTVPAPKDTKVTIVSRETHFAPGPQQSAVYQIADRIVQDVPPADAALAAQPVAQSKEAAAAAPLKVLQLQLDPPELGALTIRISLKDDALHLQIDASHHDTARLIERDRDALTGLLRTAGYGIDGANVQVTAGGDRGNGAQQFGGGGGFSQSAGQNPAGRQPENNGSGAAWQRAGTPDKTAENSRETEPPGAPLRRGGPVYL